MKERIALTQKFRLYSLIHQGQLTNSYSSQHDDRHWGFTEVGKCLNVLVLKSKNIWINKKTSKLHPQNKVESAKTYSFICLALIRK